MTRRITVKYVRGPLDGIEEDLSEHLANTAMLVGPNNYVAPEGWYTAVDADGIRTWVEGPPDWWKPKGE
jgi:hypothetical protein